MSEGEAANVEENPDVLPVGAKFGRYVIARLVGLGGIGAVYEATHSDLKKRVALKTLHPSFASHHEIRERFLREGELASRVHHPNVVDVTDFGTEGDVSFMVMEFLDGMNLGDFIESQGRLDVATAVDVMLGACAGVIAAHDEGVVHRDIKPANIFLIRQRSGDLQAKIVDFGISKATERPLEGSLTSTGHVVGTPYYMAPEQMRKSREVDGRADQYSLGVSLYEMLVGKKPFESDSLFEVVRKVAQGEFARPREVVPEIPEALEAIVLKMMAVEANDRFATLREVGASLMPFASARARVVFEHEFGAVPTASIPAVTVADATGGHPAIVSAGDAGSADGSHGVTRETFELSRVPDAATPRGSRWTIGAGVFVIASIGIAFWAGSQRERPAVPVPGTAAGSSVSGPTTRPAEYAVALRVSPVDAWIGVDDQTQVTGALARSYPRDGVSHRVTVRAAGYVTETFEFSGAIDRTITLARDPSAIAPVLAAATPDGGGSGVTTALAVAPSRPPPRGSGGSSNGAVTRQGSGRPSGSATAPNNEGPRTQTGTNGALILGE
jgi:tRNA A-37 threonylcarbamoyl transferase component Bud32